MQKETRRYISEILKKMNLADFIEREANVSFNKVGGRYMCICPMPFHRDSKPSFGVGENKDGIWLYNCFGCGSGGTILDFVKDYFDINSFEEAVVFLMERFEIQSDTELVARALKEAKVTIDFDATLECEHIQAATACRILLRKNKGNQDVESWVGNAYRKMNSLLKEKNIKGISKIRSEAISKFV